MTTESQIQTALVAICRRLGVGVFAVPNGTWFGRGRGKATWSYMHRMRGEGVLPGVPDLVFIDLADDGRPVALELKTPTGRLTSTQRVVHAAMRAAGWNVIVAHGLDDALRQLRECGVLPGGR